VSSTKPASARTPEEIEAEIAATRERLASTVDELVDKAHPRNVVKRQVEQARSQVFDAEGNLRTEKIATVAGAIAAVLVVLLLIRRMVNHR
jgi:anti-sigma factor RsiW